MFILFYQSMNAEQSFDNLPFLGVNQEKPQLWGYCLACTLEVLGHQAGSEQANTYQLKMHATAAHPL